MINGRYEVFDLTSADLLGGDHIPGFTYSITQSTEINIPIRDTSVDDMVLLFRDTKLIDRIRIHVTTYTEQFVDTWKRVWNNDKYQGTKDQRLLLDDIARLLYNIGTDEIKTTYGVLSSIPTTGPLNALTLIKQAVTDSPPGIIDPKTKTYRYPYCDKSKWNKLNTLLTSLNSIL
jgi:hypothetical protein